MTSISSLRIELIGCTGAGKTTLAREIVAAGTRDGLKLLTDQEFVLDLFGLNWLTTGILRTGIASVISVMASLVLWREHGQLAALILRTIWQLKIDLLQKVYLLRITLQKIGTDAILRRASAVRPGTAQTIVLVDEGPLLIANNLFVHCDARPDLEKVFTFVELLPLPDVAIYVRERESVLVERTLVRGHKRIPDGLHWPTHAFVQHGVELFDALATHPALRNRLVLVDSKRHITVSPSMIFAPELRRALRLVRAAHRRHNQLLAREHTCPL